jgi:hypothetical protein
MSDQSFHQNESDLYANLVDKIDNIKNNLNNMIRYSENYDSNKSLDFINKLKQLSDEITNLSALSDDMYNEYILGLSTDILTNVDKVKQKNIKNEKLIMDKITPIILYMQILLAQ